MGSPELKVVDSRTLAQLGRYSLRNLAYALVILCKGNPQAITRFRDYDIQRRAAIVHEVVTAFLRDYKAENISPYYRTVTSGTLLLDDGAVCFDFGDGYRCIDCCEKMQSSSSTLYFCSCGSIWEKTWGTTKYAEWCLVRARFMGSGVPVLHVREFHPLELLLKFSDNVPLHICDGLTLK